MKTAAVASARKSLGEYKPLIKFPDGKTEVVEQSPERCERHFKHAVVPGNRFARGTTYTDRDEAIAAAQKLIDARREDALRRYHRDKELGRNTDWVEREIVLWGGTVP